MNDIIHLCLTHSPLTSLVFQAGMLELGVPVEKIRSLTRRAVRPVGTGICLDDLADHMEQYYKKFNRSAYRRSIRDLYDQLDKLTQGTPFVAYIPHTQRIIYQEVINHPACAGYWFIEEGFTSMAWDSRGRELSPAKRVHYQLRTIWSGSHYTSGRQMFDCHDPKYRGALAISQHAFRGMPDVHNVFNSVAVIKPGTGQSRVFVVLDSSYLHHGIRWECYESAMVAAIRARAEDAVFIKFHFADSQAAARFAAVSNKIVPKQAVLLERDYPIEENLCVGDVVLFAVTSLGYYTALFGGSVECFAPAIHGLDVKQWIDKQSLPPDFEDVVRTAS